jgi:hypothetical protein
MEAEIFRKDYHGRDYSSATLIQLGIYHLSNGGSAEKDKIFRLVGLDIGHFNEGLTFLVERQKIFENEKGYTLAPGVKSALEDRFGLGDGS